MEHIGAFKSLGNGEEWKCRRVMSKQANVIATTIIVRGDMVVFNRMEM
jgi:hypothetical protein